MKRIQLLDYARFAAAAAVVCFHYFFNGINNGKITSLHHIEWLSPIAKYGYLGVPLFFMISGYVIFFSASNRTPGEFCISRAVRLFPAYWVAMACTSVVTWQLGTSNISVTLPQFFANLTMVSPIFGYSFVDGVYWTLMYELSFYLIVFFVLLVGLSKYLPHFFSIWVIAIALCLIVGYKNIPLLGGYYCYFVSGTLFAMYRLNPTRHNMLLIIVSFFVTMEFAVRNAAYLADVRNTFYNPYTISVIIFLFFLIFSAANVKKLENLSLPLSSILGNLTYPLYLIHAHIGYILLSRFANESYKWLAYSLVIAVVVTISLLIHLIFEKRLSSFWRSFFKFIVEKPVTKLEEIITPLAHYKKK